MKKTLTIVLAIIAALFLLIPRVCGIDDGGSVAYVTPLYNVVKYHSMDPQNPGEYLKGWGVEILGIELYHHVE